MMLSAKMLVAPGVLLALALAFGSAAHAQVAAARVDPTNIARVLVVRGDAPPSVLKTFDGSVVETAPSPSGTLVGAVVAHRSKTMGAPRTFRLHVLEASGETMRTIDHVQKFVFSPDEQYIAVIRGAGYEGGPGFFPESTEILGLAGPDLGPIKGLEKATDLKWSTFEDDGLVLLARVFEGRTTILEFILETRVVVPTQFLGLHFSPDGRLYYLTPGEALRANLCQAGLAHDSCVRVYERNGWRALRLQLAPTFRRTLGWADNQRMILANDRNHDCQVYDVRTDQAELTVQAVDWRWNPRPGFVIRQESPKADFRKIGQPQVRVIAR